MNRLRRLKQRAAGGQVGNRDRISKKAKFWVCFHAALCAVFALSVGYFAKHYFAADQLVEYFAFGLAWFASFISTKDYFYRKARRAEDPKSTG